MPAQRPYLTIVIPAYNEQSRLGPTLASVLAWARGSRHSVEVIVVDDGSVDATADVARRGIEKAGVDSAVLVNERNRGKGYSLRRGVLAARGELVLVCDADLSTPIQETDRLIERMNGLGHGLVIGSRALRESKVEIHQNPVREMMGKVFNKAVRLLTGLPFHDTQCGFKLMTRRDVAPIFKRARIDGFSYDVELLYVAARQGLPIEEVAVSWRNAPGSKVGILTDPFKMLRDVARIRRWHQQGVYQQVRVNEHQDTEPRDSEQEDADART